jgi:L-iditol 2-dehydrogenase
LIWLDARGSDVLVVGKGVLAAVADGADVLIECSGSADAPEAGLRGLGSGARAVVVGMSPKSHVPIALSVVQRQEITGAFRYANTYPTAIALASSGAVRLDDLVAGHYGLAQVADALMRAIEIR